MHRYLTTVALALGMLSLSAHGAGLGCEAQAAEQKLTGGEKASFVRQCLNDAALAQCEAKAGDRQGAERRNFVSDCAKDVESEAAQEVCEAQADDQKLQGEQRTTFMTVCRADRVGSG